VPGLAGNRVLRDLKRELGKLGYTVGAPHQVDTADYSVPQRRLRCVLIASRRGVPPLLPTPSSPDDARETVASAIRDLPRLLSGWRSRKDPLHFAREHKEIALKRLKHIPKDGGSRASLPARLRLKCHTEDNSFPDVYGRMAWKDVAPTLTTGCTDLTRGRYAHPRDDRAITLREAARLQTFPDNYYFSGSPGDIATQIGNAVPIRFIEELAPSLRASLRKS
jgi:DNA (cytosine-5)-methyltransferase 1